MPSAQGSLAAEIEQGPVLKQAGGPLHIFHRFYAEILHDSGRLEHLFLNHQNVKEKSVEI